MTTRAPSAVATMTERPGSRRLTAAVLLTPAAAAILAGSLAWASANPPEVALKPSSATPSATGATATDATLKKRIRAVERMRKQVASLRAELAKLEKLEIPEGDSSSDNGTVNPTPSTKPKPQPRPTRTAAPPPVDANTGAS